MALIKKVRGGKPRIDLTGPEGNVFNLLAVAKRLGTQLGLDVPFILRRMQAVDYYHAVNTFDEFFGDHVDLVYPPEWEEETQDGEEDV